MSDHAGNQSNFLVQYYNSLVKQEEDIKKDDRWILGHATLWESLAIRPDKYAEFMTPISMKNAITVAIETAPQSRYAIHPYEGTRKLVFVDALCQALYNKDGNIPDDEIKLAQITGCMEDNGLRKVVVEIQDSASLVVDFENQAWYLKHGDPPIEEAGRLSEASIQKLVSDPEARTTLLARLDSLVQPEIMEYEIVRQHAANVAKLEEIAQSKESLLAHMSPEERMQVSASTIGKALQTVVTQTKDKVSQTSLD